MIGLNFQKKPFTAVKQTENVEQTAKFPLKQLIIDNYQIKE
jgi:hypothetical protein